MSEYRVVYSPEALDDLIAIQRYIASAAGLDVARAFVSRLVPSVTDWPKLPIEAQ